MFGKQKFEQQSKKIRNEVKDVLLYNEERRSRPDEYITIQRDDMFAFRERIYPLIQTVERDFNQYIYEVMDLLTSDFLDFEKDLNGKSVQVVEYEEADKQIIFSFMREQSKTLSLINKLLEKDILLMPQATGKPLLKNKNIGVVDAGRLAQHLYEFIVLNDSINKYGYEHKKKWHEITQKQKTNIFNIQMFNEDTKLNIKQELERARTLRQQEALVNKQKVLSKPEVKSNNIVPKQKDKATTVSKPEKKIIIRKVIKKVPKKKEQVKEKPKSTFKRPTRS